MATMETRVTNLERHMGGGKGLLVVISAGPDDAENNGLLAEHGIDRDEAANMVVLLHRFAEARPSPKLLYTIPLR